MEGSPVLFFACQNWRPRRGWSSATAKAGSRPWHSRPMAAWSRFLIRNGWNHCHESTLKIS